MSELRDISQSAGRGLPLGSCFIATECLALPELSTYAYDTTMMDTLAQLPVWQLWLIAAFFLFALEIVTPGFVLACFGMGALLAIPAALFGWSWLVQVICFCVGSLVALWLLQPLMCRWFRAHDAKTGMDALIGRRVFVRERIEPGDQGGRVAVDGDVWRAVSEGGEALEPGREVRITGYQSVVLIVEPLSK